MKFMTADKFQLALVSLLTEEMYVDQLMLFIQMKAKINDAIVTA